MLHRHVLAVIAVSLPACAATQHDSDIATLCRPWQDGSEETAIVETQLASVPALMRVPAKVTQPPIHGDELRREIAEWFKVPG